MNLTCFCFVVLFETGSFYIVLTILELSMSTSYHAQPNQVVKVLMMWL